VNWRGDEEDLFGKTELLTSPEDEGRAYLIPIDPIDLPLIPIERGSTLIGKLSAAADVILPYVFPNRSSSCPSNSIRLCIFLFSCSSFFSHVFSFSTEESLLHRFIFR